MTKHTSYLVLNAKNSNRKASLLVVGTLAVGTGTVVEIVVAPT